MRPPADAFSHIRVIVGIITALSMSRLLTGLARSNRDSNIKQTDWVHTAWAVYMLLFIVHFWWFEFGFSKINRWSFGLYFFILAYAILLFLISTILFPDLADYSDPKTKSAWRVWFYGLLAVMFIVDVVDSTLKGEGHLRSLGSGYLVRQAVLVTLSVIAIFVRNRLYHAAFVSAGIAHQVWWALVQFDLLD